MKWVNIFVYGGGDIYDTSAVDHDPVTMKPNSDSYECKPRQMLFCAVSLRRVVVDGQEYDVMFDGT
jgi:hypothetical protein